MTDEKPKKISADQVQVLGADGEVVKEATSESAPFGQMKVIKGGPWLLLLLPIVIPIVIVGFFILMIFALIFGRGMFKIIKGQVRPRG